MPSVNLPLFTEPVLSLHKMGKYSLRPVGLLRLPLKSVMAGELLVEEGNINAALFGNVIPWGQRKEEGLPSACMSQATAPALKREASLFLSREGGTAEQTLYLLSHEQDFESLARLVRTLPTSNCMFD